MFHFRAVASVMHVQVLQAFLVLGLVLPLDARGKDLSVKLSPGQKGTLVKLILDNKLLTPPVSVPLIANRSISPWKNIDNYKASRFPQYISQANCLMSGCLQGGREDRRLESKPVYYETLVLHRVRKGRKKDKMKDKKAPSGMSNKVKEKSQYVFRLTTEIIAAGCTCVRPSMVPQL